MPQKFQSRCKYALEANVCTAMAGIRKESMVCLDGDFRHPKARGKVSSPSSVCCTWRYEDFVYFVEVIVYLVVYIYLHLKDTPCVNKFTMQLL